MLAPDPDSLDSISIVRVVLVGIDVDGTAVENFPLELGEKIQRGVALADFNGNGKDDIVCGTDDQRIYLIYDDGTIAEGFPFEANGDFRTAPVVVDVGGAKTFANMLKSDKDFYNKCSKECKENYNKLFSEKVYIYTMNKVIEEVINEIN